MSVSTQFILPGRRNSPMAATKAALAWNYISSRACNPRNLEHRTYGLWNLYLIDLTTDSRTLLLIPQHILYYNPEDFEEDDNENQHPGDTTVSTIDSIASTTPDNSTKQVIPDFAIIHIKYCLRNPAEPRTSRNVKVQHIGVPALAEGKRMGSRSSTTAIGLLQSTELEINLARTDLLKQAAYLFRMHSKQESVVLIAFSGRFWSCRVVRREDVIHLAGIKVDSEFEPTDLDAEDAEDEDDDNEGRDDSQFDIELVDDDFDELNTTHGSPESEHQASQSPASTADYLEPVVPDANLMLPTTEWTRLLALETSASNQQFYLIHAHLQDVIQDNTGQMG